MNEPETTSPMFPLGTVLLPGETIPLHVFEERYRVMTAAVLEGDGTFGVILIARGSEVGGGDQRVAIGTLARIVEAAPFSDGRYALLVRGESRIRVIEWLSDDPFPLAHVAPLPSLSTSRTIDVAIETLASVRRCRALLSELGAPLIPWDGSLDSDDPELIAWRLGSLAPFGTFDRQHLLEIDDPIARLQAIRELSLEIADDATRILSEGTEDL